MYLIKPINSKRAFAIDPVDHKRIAHEVIGLGTSLESILCTHHHADHDGGNIPLKRLYPQLDVFGIDERIHGLTNQLKEQPVQDLKVCGLDVKVLHTPCHTNGHRCVFWAMREKTPINCLLYFRYKWSSKVKKKTRS